LKTLLTGASGFLGQAILNCFDKERTTSIGRQSSNNIIQDLSKPFKLNEDYDLVIHCAGKAHSIPNNEKEEKEFFEINERGTQHLINALEENLPKRLVFISTVAVYGDSATSLIDEDHDLLGSTPYAKSKINSEKIIKKWSENKGVEYLILRLPLICGKNPPGNLEAMANAMRKGYYFRIGKGESRKSMVGANDIAQLIFKNEWKSGVYNLTDGIHPTIKDTDQHLAKMLNKNVKVLPIGIVKILAIVGDVINFFPLNSLRLKKLTSSLTFSDSKARKELGWNPKPALSQLSYSFANE
jgi:nucleoside-diphosphate-sugar epimerase